MHIIVVGGSASKVGKTRLSCLLVAQAARDGRVVALKVSAHARRRRPEIAAYAFAPRHVAFHDTDRFLAAGAHVAIALEAGIERFRDHLAFGLRRARAYRADTLIIESTTAGAELRIAHDSWFVAGEMPWKPGVERHFARAGHVVRTHELAKFTLLVPSLRLDETVAGGRTPALA